MSLAYNKFLEIGERARELFHKDLQRTRGFADYMKELLQDLEFEYRVITVDWRCWLPSQVYFLKLEGEGG